MAGTSDRLTLDAGQIAIVICATVVASVVSLVIFFTVGDPFGTINDVLNAGIGVGSALLALKLRPRAGSAVVLAVTGAGVVAVGSALVISSTTGFFVAGHVSSVGFALIGIWLVVVNRSLAASGSLPSRLTTVGTIIGGLMALGLLTAPGIVAGIDSMETAPAWIWVGYIGWLGLYVLYPAWALRLGRTWRNS